MIQVRFKTYELDPDTTEWVEQPVAELIANGQEVTISGPHSDWINLDITIVDPESGEKVVRAEDAERWARLLPFAYRSGDIAVRVSEVASASPVAGAFRYSTAA